MIDFRLLNGHKKGTAIVRFDHSALMLIDGKRKEFKSIGELKRFKEVKKIEVNVEHVHPMMSKSEMRREWSGSWAWKEKTTWMGAIRSAARIFLENIGFDGGGSRKEV